ncbi:MAG: Uncharacterized protein AWU57_303 [Marinobacter sp. T13-3]|nr:MAG: Uncharacterized protein AWU57_303 [Marinobacter sp. T13-3]
MTTANTQAKLTPVPADAPLRQALSVWERQVKHADTPEKIRAIGDAIEAYGRPLMPSTWLEHSAVVLLMLIAIACLMGMYSEHPLYLQITHDLSDTLNILPSVAKWVFPVACVITAVYWESLAITKHRRVGKLADTLINRLAALEYGLQPIKADALNASITEFGELQRGNHERSIHDCYAGNYDHEDTQSNYQVYRLHYVDKKRTRTGTGKSRNQYTHYDRSGIVMTVPRLRQLHISTGYENTLYPASFKPASMAFNEKFECRGVDDMQLARLLRPKMVEHLIRTSYVLDGLGFEINDQGRLLISCKTTHVAKMNTQDKGNQNVDPRYNPRGFNTLLKTPKNLRTLNTLLSLAREVKR